MALVIVHPRAFLQGWWLPESTGGGPTRCLRSSPRGLAPCLDSCSPCLVHPLGGRRAEIFLQGEGMSGFGPGPATHSCRAAWRKTVPSPPR